MHPKIAGGAVSCMTKIARSALIVSALLTLAQPTFAQSDPKKDLIETYIKVNQRPGMSGNLFRLIADVFGRLDANGDGISRDELELAEAITVAAMRSQLVGQMLSNDLDGDLAITIDEYMKVHSSRQGRLTGLKDYPKSDLDRLNQQTTARFRENDTDGNQTISGPELYEGLKKRQDNRAEFGPASTYELVRAMLNADPNKDDRITETESLALLAEAGLALQQ